MPETDIPPALSERHLRACHRFGAAAGPEPVPTPWAACRAAGNGAIEVRRERIAARFEGAAGAYRVVVHLPAPCLSNGLSARIRLGGWRSMRYLAVGHGCEGVFRHVKVPNPPQGGWFDVTIGYGDILYGLQNEWSHPAATPVGDVRIEMRGEPGDGGGTIEVERLLCFEEEGEIPSGPATCARPAILPRDVPAPDGWRDAVEGHFGSVLRRADELAAAFMEEGACPLIGASLLPWAPDAPLPAGLSATGTHAFSWHALHPAAMLLLHARATGSEGPVFAARELASQWLDRSYYVPDPDRKYAWYEHGVADRTLVLLLLREAGIERGFDRRVMTRLGEACARHAQLLESEGFYVSHQRVRHHNHGCFQDLALLAAAVAMPDYPSAPRWRDRACERLREQFAALVVRDGGFAVCVENSIGYQNGIEHIARFAVDLSRVAGMPEAFAGLSDGMAAFSELLRYPDGSTPAQGDTFPDPPRPLPGAAGCGPEPARDFVLLPEAGYGVVRGLHDGSPFMVCLFATAQSATHKHEDDLSFTLFFDGVEWLTDPGFHSHEYRQPLPAYLRSAVAHNALVLPDMPYSIEPGLARLSGASEGNAFRIEGAHDRHPDRTVTRRVEGALDALALRFTDGVRGGGAGDAALLMLHCGDGVVVRVDGARAVLSHPRSRYRLTLALPSDAIAVSFGEESESRVRGFRSAAFLERTPIHTLECRVTAGRPLEWSIDAVGGPAG